MAAVVKEGVTCLLQHPLLVPDNDVGRFEFEDRFQAVIPIDHAAVEIV